MENFDAILRHSFIDDDEKMEDFNVITKDEFLFSYSYLSEKEYDMIFLQSNDRYENLMRKSKKFVYSNLSNKTLDFYEDL